MNSYLFIMTTVILWYNKKYIFWYSSWLLKQCHSNKGERNIFCYNIWFLSHFWNSSRAIKVKGASFVIPNELLSNTLEFMLMRWLLESPWGYRGMGKMDARGINHMIEGWNFQPHSPNLQERGRSWYLS